MLLEEGLERLHVHEVVIIGVSRQRGVEQILESVVPSVVSELGVAIIVMCQTRQFPSLPREVAVEQGGVEGHEAEHDPHEHRELVQVLYLRRVSRLDHLIIYIIST